MNPCENEKGTIPRAGIVPFSFSLITFSFPELSYSLQ